jgi:hypothetical protein
LTDLLNTFFISVGGQTQEIDQQLIDASVTSPVLTQVDIGLVKIELERIKTSKSVNSEDYPPWITKEYADFLCEPLTDIINSMFQQNKYPAIWKCAEVVPLPKVKTPTQCKDFRPISLLFHCGKVAEKFFMEEYKKQILPSISNQQFAYRSGVGTTDALIYTLDQWTAMLDQSNTAVEVIFKDFTKAFDSLQPNKLIAALKDLDATPSLLQLALSFLTERKQRVRIKSDVSEYAATTVGVPQGTLAGPMFWLAFINSYKPPSSSSITLYADDVTCSAPVSTSCDNHIPNAIEWGLSWSKQQSMTLNLTKTKAMLITLCSNSKPPTIFSPVDLVDEWKFLGITIDKFLNFNAHITDITSRAKKRFYVLLQLKRMGISKEKLCLFYTSNIRSILTYCIPAFFGFLSNRHKETLESIQKLCTKIILPNEKDYLKRLTILQLPDLKLFSEELCHRHFLKIYNDENHQLRSLIPEKQSANRRHSTRLRYSFLVTCRTTKRQQSFFITIVSTCNDCLFIIGFFLIFYNQLFYIT